MQTHLMQFDFARGWNGPFPDVDHPNTLIIAFGETGVLDNPAPIEELLKRFPRSNLIGCSSSGQIVGDTITDAGLAALFVTFERGNIRVASDTVADASQSEAAARSLARELAADDLSGVFVLSDGAMINGSSFAAGLRAGLPEGLPITGGLAGDGERFERTWVCCNGLPQVGRVAAAGIYGPELKIWHGCQGGWDAFGPERRVTRSRQNVLLELDGQPALGIYENYLGEKASELPASALLFPLALRRSPDAPQVVRTVLNVDREAQTMTFAGDIPEGAMVQMMQANFDRLVDGAAKAAGMIPLDRLSNSSSVCIPISCVGRRIILRHRAEDELDEVCATLPFCQRHFGFYSYGEIAPHADLGCELHNQTMTLTVFAEINDAAPRAGKTAA